MWGRLAACGGLITRLASDEEASGTDNFFAPLSANFHRVHKAKKAVRPLAATE
jgi:hypothetical protein